MKESKILNMKDNTSLQRHRDDMQEVRDLAEEIDIMEKNIEYNSELMSEQLRRLDDLGVRYTKEENILRIPEEDINAYDISSLEIIETYNKYSILNTRTREVIDRLEKKDVKGEIRSRVVNNNLDLSGIGILQAQECERSRIARDLHDSVIQDLVNLVHKSELCIRTVDHDVIGVKLDLQLMMNSLKSIIDEIRTIIYNLRPMILEDLGVDTAIQRYIDRFEKENKISIHFNYYCKDFKIQSSIVTLTIFRIVQEACSNAVKHGHANRIIVELTKDSENIYLKIQDNGCGFDQNIDNTDKEDNSGFGLSIMKERVCLLAGEIDIQSKLEKGTTITISIPIKLC